MFMKCQRLLAICLIGVRARGTHVAITVINKHCIVDLASILVVAITGSIAAGQFCSSCSRSGLLRQQEQEEQEEQQGQQGQQEQQEQQEQQQDHQ